MRSLLCLTLLLATALESAAQGTLNCRLLNFNRQAEDIDSLFVVNADGKPFECQLPTESLSDPTVLPVVEQSLVFRKDPDGQPIATGRVPRGMAKALVILLPSSDPDETFQPLILEDSGKSFPADGAMVVNLYAEDIRFIIGEHRKQLKPGQNVGLERPAERNNFNMAAVNFQFKTTKGWRSAYESMIRFPGEQRHLFITIVEPRSKRPRIVTIRD